MHIKLRSGDCRTTKIDFINENDQKCHGTIGVKGTDHRQYVYRLECLCCGFIYGANGSDIWELLCPKCQDGKPSIAYWLS